MSIDMNWKKKVDEAIRREMKESFNLAVMKYVNYFLEKQGYEYIEHWIGEPGDIAEIADRYFNFRDIKYDIDTEQPAGRIIDWDDMCLENQKFNINYESYCLGLRPKHVIESERKESLAKSKQDVKEAKEYLEQAIKDEVNAVKKGRNKSKNT